MEGAKSRYNEREGNNLQDLGVFRDFLILYGEFLKNIKKLGF